MRAAAVGPVHRQLEGHGRVAAASVQDGLLAVGGATVLSLIIMGLTVLPPPGFAIDPATGHLDPSSPVGCFDMFHTKVQGIYPYLMTPGRVGFYIATTQRPVDEALTEVAFDDVRVATRTSSMSNDGSN